MVRNGINPANLKYIMGHSDIDVTFNVYTRIGIDDVWDDMLKVSENAA
ncbi:hypothetical protein [Lancefieldella parvula]